MFEHKENGLRAIEGMSFEIDDLTTLNTLALPGIRVEIAIPATTVEELVVFRLGSKPDIIAATLRRSSAGPFKLVGYDLSRGSNEPLVEASFPNFDLALLALTALFSDEVV